MNNFQKKDVSGMPSTSRPRGMSGTGSGGSGRPAVTAPMSERQQMALLMQMTSTAPGNEGEMSPGSSGLGTAGSGSGGHSRRDRINERGETALHLSSKKGDQETVKKLLEQGSNPNVTDFAGWTPLHEACNHGHYNVALALIKAGANINATGLENDTPLHDAAIVGQLKLCKMLVERGADPTFKNQKGKMPCDVSAPAVYNYLLQARDNATNRLQQQLKKPSDSTGSKKGTNQDSDADDINSGGIGGSNASSAVNKDEDDIYEFKSTPKDSSSSSSDEKESNSDKNEKSSADKNSTAADGDTIQSVGASGTPGSGTGNASVSKRPFSEVNDAADDSTGTSNDDDNKRKKRKDSDTTNKETTKGGTSGNRGSAPRQEKSGKSSGPPSKNLGLTGKNTLDRKSPCASPKPAVNTSSSNSTNKPSNSNANDSDAEGDDASSKASDSNFNSGGGPKVPPLKIVIPQQSSGGDTEAGGSSRNGKNASARNHPALPYVVASSNSNDSSADKESTSSRSASPSDSKSSDEKTTSKSNDERAQSRVLRSHRGGGSNASSEGGGGSRNKDNQSDRSVDRSNNSSPQMQQSSAAPSPASNSGDAGTGGNNSTGMNQNKDGGSTASPSSANQKESEPEAGTSSSTNPKSPPVSSSSTTTTTNTSSSSNTNNNTGGGNSNQNNQSNSTTSSSTSETAVHPRKRKIKTSKDQSSTAASSSSTPSTSSSASTSNEEKKEIKEETPDVHPHDQPITNCYQMFLNIRRQIERRQRSLFPVQPKPPQGFKDYLLNRCAYALAGKTPSEPNIQPPTTLQQQMKEIFSIHEKERHKLKMQHIVEKEKLVLAVEQEILRVHGRAARALANQSLPFSVCTILKDEEVYNIITPEQEEKDRNARSRYNGRLFLSWLQDVDDKWEKIKEAMLLRHHNEAESLHAVQKMDWEWKMKENSLCEFKAKPVIEESHVPMVNVSDDFDLLPA